MSDFPYKVGDLITVKTTVIQHAPFKTQEGVIIHDQGDGFFDVLIEGEVKIVHRNYIVTPKVTAVKLTGGQQ
jgi:hypothetical protein